MITSLTNKEKVFLAGAMKSMMLADGKLDEQELIELDVLLRRLNFDDYEERLAEFETKVKDEEGFWEEAAAIVRPEARAVIAKALQELLLHEGIPELTEEHLLRRLEKSWKA